MGYVLSARGIGPADVKVKAVVDACEPTNTWKNEIIIIIIIIIILFI